jgi:histone-lysine N-methyltransferase SETMAR
MSEEKIALRGLLRHYWKKGLSAKAATDQICEVEGTGTVHRNTVAIWFRRFNDGDTSLLDKPRTGRPSEVDNATLKATLKENPHLSTRELATRLGHSHTTIIQHAHQLDFKSKRPRLDAHHLSITQANNRVKVCQQLLQNPIDDRFWKRIVTCDEKWIFLNNPDTRKKWVLQGEDLPSVVRQDRFGKKVMLSVWWNYEGVLHFELIPNGRSVDGELYCEQLDRVHEVLKTRYPALVNRKRVLYHHDNAPAHRSRLAKEKINEFDTFEILPHPAYSPDIAPSDYGLFRSMAHYLRGRHFANFDDVKHGCQEFFVSKPKDWYHHQIELLAERWIRVIENDGLYFEE